MTLRRLVPTTAACVIAASALALADSRIAFKTTEGQSATLDAILIGHGKIRTDSDKTTSAILDPAAGTMTVLDHGRKTYIRLTRADVEKMVAMASDMMKQMEQAMANVPPEMRERMKGMMGGAAAAGPAIEFADTGKTATVGGVTCRVFQGKAMGRVAAETCMGDPSAIQLPAADRATLVAAMAWYKELADKLTSGPLARVGSASPFRGGLVPLRSTTIGPDGSRSTSEFAGVTSAEMSADTFTVPAGYKEQKIELPGRGRGGLR